MTTAIKLTNSLNANIASRVEYEDAKNTESSNVTTLMIKAFNIDHKTLKTNHKKTYFESLIDQAFVADFDFINNSVKSNARFNVYALQKAALKLNCVAQRKLYNVTSLHNKFCIASVLTCLQNRDKESFSFDRKHAHAMLSKACNYETVARSDLAQKFDVSASTATTQVSSSFRVLEALNILQFDETQRARSIVSNVNYDNAFLKLVQEHFKIA